jgi:hypothetical protein
LACLAILASGTASAGVSVGIGVGTTFGHHHHHHPGWYSGVYVGPSYWYDPWYDPWWDPYPVVVVPPVVRERRVIVHEYKPAPPAPKVEPAEPLSEKQLQTRSEALKVIKIGDVESRFQAVQDLEPFAHDEKVRTALQDRLSNDREPAVRKAVAELFGRLKDPKTLPTLRQAYAEDEDREVRQAAYKAIAMMEGYKGL